jgi:serine/threonine protein kinase/Tol biopolymer transport system component
MALKVGDQLGSHEITALLGKGGMGEVYRARDLKLKREVAVKILPEEFSRDRSRLIRFQREAEVLASLNHPHIASIYGIEYSGNTPALVMELAEGPTLADRIRQGPIPIDEALAIARQIADALEYAHERGIIHRDLKPANVKVAGDDTVKVLDFGLAKALGTTPSVEDIANSPTISHMTTGAGVLLGTASYMSPEQARAKLVDRRADIWAFGCVVYEMLTGKMAFRGESVTETLAAVLNNEPDWSALPAGTPPHVRVLLQRCLQKDAKQRLRDIGDARISLDEVPSLTPDHAPSLAAVGQANTRRWLWLVSGIAGLLLLATVLLKFLYLRQQPAVPQVVSFEIPLPENVASSGGFALSPDGSTLAFIGRGADGQARLWLRPLETLVARPIAGSEGAQYNPFWSPDGRSVAFFAQGKLRKIDAAGGSPRTLCDDITIVNGGAYSGDDRIVFATNQGLLQVPADGGSCSPMDTAGGAHDPSFLPDGRHFLFWRWDDTRGSEVGIYRASIDAKAQERPSKLLSDTSNVVYVPSPDPAIGYLLFVRGSGDGAGSTGTLMALRFDTRSLKPVGEAVPIAEHVPNLGYKASGNVLVYVQRREARKPGIDERQLTWLARDGKVLGTVGEPGIYHSLALSPDDKSVVFERGDPQDSGTSNLWLYEFARDVPAPLTFGKFSNKNPVWAPDNRIAFGSFRNGHVSIFQIASNFSGKENLLVDSVDSVGDGVTPSDWSADGRFLLFYNSGVQVSHQLSLLPLNTGNADLKLIPLESSGRQGRFSPDGHWIAYSSNESGRPEIYLRPFEPSSATKASDAKGTPAPFKIPVSKDGGTDPRWRGKELFYRSSDGNVMAVDVSTSGSIKVGVPKPLKIPAAGGAWDVFLNGQQFLMAVPLEAQGATQRKYAVVLNWQTSLKK